MPNVSYCVNENEVHYNPSTPPTPSLSITSITLDDTEVETPFCDNGGFATLHFSRPVNFNELQNLVFEADYTCDDVNPKIVQHPTIEGGVMTWIIPDSYGTTIWIDEFDGTVDSVELGHGDDIIYYNRISI